MGKYDLEVTKLDKVISDLEARLAAGFDPAFNEMLESFRALREKYRRLLDTGPRPRYSDRNKPHWGNTQPEGQ
jgi:hypothetical protein